MHYKVNRGLLILLIFMGFHRVMAQERTAQQAEELFLRAASEVNNGNYNLGDSLLSLLQKESIQTQNWEYLGLAYLNRAKVQLKVFHAYEPAFENFLQPMGKLLDAHPELNLGFRYDYHNNLAFYYSEMGRFRQALDVLRVNQTLEKQTAEHYTKKGTYLKFLQLKQEQFNTQIIVFNNSGKPDSSLKYVELTFQLISEIEKMGGKKAEFLTNYYSSINYINKGLAYELKEDFDKSLAAYHKALTFEGDINPYVQANTHLNMGVIYLLKKQYSKAETLVKRSIEESIPILGSYAADLAKSYEILAMIKRTRGQLDSAKFYQLRTLALQSTNPRYYYSREEVPKARELRPTIQTFIALKNRTETLMEKVEQLETFDCEGTKQDSKHKEEILQLLSRAREATQVSRLILDSIRSTGVIGAGLEKYGPADTLAKQVKNGVRLAYLFKQYYPQEDFRYDKETYYYAEIEKFSQLYFGLIQKKTQQLREELPKDKQKLELDLLEDINAIKVAVLSEGDPDIAKQKRARLDSLQKALELFKQKLATEHPQYYRTKYQAPSQTLETIKSKLENKEAILEFFEGDERIYSFLLTRDTFICRSICRDSIESELVAVLDALHQSPIKTGEDFDWEKFYEDYAVNSHFLYKNLLKRDLDFLKSRGEKSWYLKIVADGKLQGMNWYTCLRRIPDYETLSNPGSWDYLLYDSAVVISHQYSTAIYFEHRGPRQTTFTHEYGGFAPSYSQNDLAEARNSVAEIGKMLKQMGLVDIFIGSPDSHLTKEVFLENALKYRILHLSMHGQVDWNNPGLSALKFSDKDSLTAQELYLLNLNNALVILDACETGVGRDYPTDGAMSLATAFAYAGISSSLTSLWKVDERASRYLVRQFLDHLTDGKRVDQSWKFAQLDYLLKGEQPKHPYFWASMVPLGNMEAIYPEKSEDLLFKYLLIGLGILALILAAWLILARRRT